MTSCDTTYLLRDDEESMDIKTAEELDQLFESTGCELVEGVLRWKEQVKPKYFISSHQMEKDEVLDYLSDLEDSGICYAALSS
jgi:50S ribosomal subunit-associated GTPase HflX